jgi:hypothetical protein
MPCNDVGISALRIGVMGNVNTIATHAQTPQIHRNMHMQNALLADD